MKTRFSMIATFILPTIAMAQFAAVPTLDDKPWRSFVGFTESMGFDPVRHTQFETKMSLVHKIYPGFDVGVCFHSGFSTTPNPPALMGVDFMGRYLAKWNSWIFGGWQLQVGYTYNGIGLASRSATVASTIPITTGPLLGFVAAKNLQFYWAPSLELGRKNYTKETGFWGQLVGFQSSFGSAIILGNGHVFSMDLRPRYSDEKVFMDFTAAWVLNF